MSVYPPDTLRHLTPLVLISGLAIPDRDEPVSKLRLWAHNNTDSALSQHPFNGLGEQLATAPALRDYSEEDVIMPELFYKFAQKSVDPSNWNPQAMDLAKRKLQHFLNIQYLSSDDNPEYTLPPIKQRRKDANANQNLQQRELDDSASIASRQSTDVRLQYPGAEFHSPLSPLTPSSDLYPDGVISEKWLQKYQYFMPSTFVSIHLLKHGEDTGDQQIEADEALSKKLNLLKNQISQRNIKLIVIIVSEVLPSVDPSLNDRIYYLRKSTGLAPRTGLFFLPPATEVELETLVETVCQLSFNQALDFYANIAKQIRRKRGGRPKTLNISPEDAAQMTTSPLSNAGWDIRYYFKLAALAEFRQELEAATNAYETTYEMALELFETFHPVTETPTVRWNEFRSFLDTLAFRIVRLHFYNGQPHIAYKKFLIHLKIVASILDGRGFSRNGFSYKNWRATQYHLLASLVNDTAGLLFNGLAPFALNANEFEPADCLPRSALLNITSVDLWLDLLSSNYNEGDLCDPYLGKEGTDIKVIKAAVKDSLQAAVKDLSLNTEGRPRSLGYAYYLLGETKLIYDQDSASAQEEYKNAVGIYRKDNWDPLLMVILQRLVETSLSINDYKEAILSKLELSLRSHTTPSTEELEDLVSKLSLEDTQTIDIDSDRNLGLYSAEFTFLNNECFLGLPIQSQVTLTCNYPSTASDESRHTLTEFTVAIVDELASLHVLHNPSLPVIENGYTVLSNLTLEDDTAGYLDRVYRAEANLTFKAGQSIVFEFTQIPKRLGEARFAGITPVANHENVLLRMKIPTSPNLSGAISWYSLTGGKLSSRFVRISNPYRTKLSRRPSLITIGLDRKDPVALGERALLNAIIFSGETEEVILEIQAKGITNKGDAIEAKWATAECKSDAVDLLHGLRIAASNSKSIPLEIQIPSGTINSITLEFFVSYYSANDEETLIKDDVIVPLNVLKPFVVNFDISPRFHPDPWQSFFLPTAFNETETEVSFGINPSIQKKWELCASMLCLTEGNVEVLGSELKFVTAEGTSCEIFTDSGASKQLMAHNESQKFNYIFHSGRTGDKEIRHVNAEAHLKILWQRPVEDGIEPIINEFTITPVRLSLPLIEPRVIVGKFNPAKATALLTTIKKLSVPLLRV